MTETDPPDRTANAQTHLQTAYEYIEQSDLQNALNECQIAIQLAPDSADAHNLHGIILDRLGKTEQAILAYREAIRLNPAFDEAIQNLAEAQTELDLSQRKLQQDEIWRVAKWGAWGYGTGLTLFGVLSSLLPLLFLEVLVSYVYVLEIIKVIWFALAGGWGGIWLGKGMKPSNATSIGKASGLGFGLGYLLSIALFIGVSEIGMSLQAWSSIDLIFIIAQTVRYGFMGGFTGWLIGKLQKDRQQLLQLVLTGAIGLGLYGLLHEIWGDKLLGWIFRFAFNSPNAVMQYFSISTVISAIQWGGIGIIVGGGFGAAIKYKPITKPDNR